ncbi:MAG: hypothetical protein U0Q16_25460 [Bryobacteraceae bacterium]
MTDIVTPALVIRLRPEGPWRIGPSTGAKDRADRVFHSDQLYSAVTSAMQQLDWMEEWLDATARAADPMVRVSSLFPWQGGSLMAPAPAHLWPAPASRLRTSGARFIPTALIGDLANGEAWNEDQWEVDGLSQCLLRRGRRNPAGPFRLATRSRFACDRLEPGAGADHQTACIEFSEQSGVWCAVVFASVPVAEQWGPRIRAAFKLLSDTGLGGERTSGWGQFTVERADPGDLAELLFGKRNDNAAEGESEAAAAPAESAHWLLSLFRPASSDTVDWNRGSYTMVERSGRSGAALKKTVRMVEEGSVLFCAEAPRGAAADVAPDGFAHPVYSAGFAVSLPLPWRVNV